MHKLYTSKYQSQATQLSNNIASLVVALCEKGISCISNAIDAHKKNDKPGWCSNLGTVQEVINIISTTLVVEKEDQAILEMRKFYKQLSLYTSALIADRIDAAKAQDLLESFRITRDTWRNVEQKYIEEANLVTRVVLENL